jgi:hypothetical protein
MTTGFAGETSTGEEWKVSGMTENKVAEKAVNFENSAETENDRADLSPEETLEVDNWLLSQGIDSGTGYVEKLDEIISEPAEPAPEKNEAETNKDEAEAEIISPKVIEYLETQEPESILNSLSAMTDTELDQAIEMIEAGEIDAIGKMLEPKPETATAEATVESKPETITPPRKKAAWESDPNLPDFSKIDGKRHEELKTMLKEYREVGRKNTKLAEKAFVTSEKEKITVKTETQTGTGTKSETVKINETLPREDDGDGPVSIEKLQTDVETREKQKSSGVVAYDIPPEALLRDVKIVIVERAPSEGWMLPQTIIDAQANERKDTEEKIDEKYGLEIKIDEKLEHAKQTIIKTDTSEITSEKAYYTAEADSTKELRHAGMQWVTLAEIQAEDYGLSEKDLEIIAEVAQEIKDKMEKEQAQAN